MNNCVNSNNFNICNSNNTSFCNGIGLNYSSVGIRPYCFKDLCNQCGKCFCCNCCSCCPGVPTGPLPPLPPMPPLPPLPPMPPIPPRPMGSFGQFMAQPQMLNSGQVYVINNINIQGDAIEYDPGTNTILLKPNTIYNYAYMTEIMTLGGLDRDLINFLVLDNAIIPGSQVSELGVLAGVPTVLQANGQFVTGNVQGRLFLVFSTNPDRGQAMTSATITITEILP